LHNGTAQAASTNGEGSTFTVSIPLGHTDLPAHRVGAPRTLATTNVGAAGYLVELQRWLSNASTENSPISLPLAEFSPELTPVAPAVKRARVLLADDNADMREYVTRLLSSQFEVVCAADGQSALELAQREKPDLILSDIMMPRLDGLGLLQAVRSDSELRTIPVILLSARAGEEARISGLTAGADDYLVKPFGARELMARVETHIQMMNVRRHSEQTIRGLKEELQIQLERERARAAELEAIMAALPAPVFIAKDPQSRFIYGNRAAYELLRMPQGSNLSLTAPPEERADFKVLKDGSEVQTDNLPSQAAARGVEQRDIEIEIVVGNAAPAHLYGNAVPLRDAEGSPYGSIATFVDITERKRAVQRLALQYEVATIMANADSIEEALRGLLPAVGGNLGWDVGEIWSLDREADCLRCVTHWQRSSISAEGFIAAGREMTFLRGAGLPGRVWQTSQPAWIEDVSLDDNFRRLAAASREHLQGAVAFPILFKDELLGVIEFFSRRLAPPDAAVLRTLAAIGSQVGQFIERKRMEAERNQLLAAEQSARAQLEQEREILEVVNRSGLMLSAELDLERLVQALTDAATDITGAQFGSFFYNLLDDRGGSYMLYTLSGVPREHFSNFPMPRATDLFGPTFRGEGIVRLHDVKQDPRFGKNSPYYGMPKGHLSVTSYLAVPVVSRSGEVLGGLFFGHAEAGIFTERHELIVRGLASQAAIAIDNARLYEAAHKAKSEAERANRLKDDFLATVSHELRTPLTAMLGWSRLLRGGKLDERKKAQGLEILERNAFAQQQIIEDILDASRIIAGKLRLQASPVEIAPVVETVMASTKPAADDNGVKLQATFPNDSIVVLGDAGRLQQIVWNLVSNAVKFTPSGGEVNVKVERIDARAEVTVRDTGQGIDKEFLPFVFERFRQADSSSTRQFGGLGLGLAIVRHLTELHGGQVTAFSAGEGQGSTFTVSLPLAAGQESKALSNTPDSSPRRIENNPFPGHANLEGIRVLAVDDEADTRELLTVLLTQCKVEVRTAGSAAEALATVEVWQPDLLISDLAMPDEDGITLIRKLRALPAAKGGSIPAIALTAYAHSDDRENALAAGYQRHIAKPVEPSELVAALSALAGMKRKAKRPSM
jgi:signal transduction histidine kinase/DNA-binding response OmpR family regulator